MVECRIPAQKCKTEPMHTVVSIQSHVAYGHAGNSSAVFPLQRLGLEVWPVHTVTFSNHTGYGSWRGPLLEASQVADVVTGIDERGVLGQADALLVGYQGSPDVGQVILAAADLVKQRNPEAVFCVDPVMGDVGRGFYARPGIPEFMRDHVVPAADIVAPNLFELEFLTDSATHTAPEVLAAIDKLREMGPRTVLVTSVVGTDLAHDVMRMFAVSDEGSWMVETPLIDRDFTGSGDLTTAVFLAELLETGDLGTSLSHTASVVYSILQHTHEQESQELALISGQHNLVEPDFVFQAQQLVV